MPVGQIYTSIYNALGLKRNLETPGYIRVRVDNADVPQTQLFCDFLGRLRESGNPGYAGLALRNLALEILLGDHSRYSQLSNGLVSYIDDGCLYAASTSSSDTSTTWIKGRTDKNGWLNRASVKRAGPNGVSIASNTVSLLRMNTCISASAPKGTFCMGYNMTTTETFENLQTQLPVETERHPGGLLRMTYEADSLDPTSHEWLIRLQSFTGLCRTTCDNPAIGTLYTYSPIPREFTITSYALRSGVPYSLHCTDLEQTVAAFQQFCTDFLDVTNPSTATNPAA